MADYDEVVELTWENGHLSAHSLVKPVARYSASTAGTLESVVDQANMLRQPSTGNTGPVSAEAVDALVATRRSLQCDDLASGIECDGRKRARVSPGSGGGSRDSITAGCGTTDTDFGFGVSRLPDTENTSFGSGGVGGGGGSKATMDDHYSACHSRRSLSQMEAGGDEDEKVTDGGTMRSTISTKRTRAAAVHNQSERKRRDKINQRIRTLQKLVPNSSKTDKASMLDEVIEYLKQLQAQVQMISRMSSIPTLPMTMPMGMQQFQMAMMAQMAQITQMVKMGMTMGFMPDIGHMAATPSSLVRPNFGPVAAAAVPSVLQPQFLPVVGGGSSWDHPLVAEKKQQSNDAAVVMHDSFPTFVACPTQQPMTLDAYHRMAAVYQQMFQQNQASNPK